QHDTHEPDQDRSLKPVGHRRSPPRCPGQIYDTSRKSTLGPPLAVVAVARTALPPADSATVTVASAQVSHEPVPLKFTVIGAPPSTVMVIGRLVVVPLAYRIVSVALPAAAAGTDHSAKLPVALA